MKNLITVQRVAEILEVKKSWIYGRVHAGNLPFQHLKIGTYLRFRLEDIEKYIENELKAASCGREPKASK